jgi:hypothetical protein
VAYRIELLGGPRDGQIIELRILPQFWCIPGPPPPPTFHTGSDLLLADPKTLKIGCYGPPLLSSPDRNPNHYALLWRGWRPA